MSDSVITWTATRQASLSFTISCSLLKLMSIESVMPSNHLILCCPLLLLPSIFPSIRQLISLCATTTFFQEHQVMCDLQCFCPCLTHLSLFHCCQSLGLEDLLEEGMATHSSILAWRIPWTEEPGGLQSMRSQRVGHK